jgi:hypothetical protein
MDGLSAATAGVKGATADISNSFNGMNVTVLNTFKSMPPAAERAADEMEETFSKTEARHAAHMLGMNRAVGSFAATIPGVGAALSMAFAPLAIIEMIMWIAKGVEKLMEFREAGKKLAEDQQAFETAANNAFNSLGDKILEAEKKTDELAGDHMGALAVELQLIDHTSMKDLVAQFDLIGNAADKVFSDLTSHWYTFGQGSDGAKHALDEFNGKYKNLLSQGTDKGKQEASNLLSGTLQTAYDILKAQQTIVANRQSGEGMTDERFQAEKVLEAHKVSLVVSDSEVSAQKELLEALGKQVMAEEQIKTLTADNSKNAKTEAGNKGDGKGDKADKDPSSEQMTGFKQELEAKKGLEENWFTWSIAREIAFWQEKKTAAGLGAKAVADIDDNINKLKQKGAEEDERNAEKHFERLYSASAKGSEERVKLASDEVARVGAVYHNLGPAYEAAQARLTEATKEQAAARRALEKAQIDGERTLELEGADKIIQLDRERQAAGRISKQALLQDEKDYIKTKYGIELQAAQDELKLLTEGTAAYQVQMDKILAMKRKETAEEATLDKKAAADHLKTTEKWVDGLTSGFSSGISGMIKGTESFGQAFKNVMGSAVDFIIQQMVKMLAKHLSVEIAKTTATTAQTGVRTGAQSAADAKTMASDTVTAAHHAGVEEAKTGSTWAGSAARVAAEIWASLKTMATKLAEGIQWIAIEGWKAAASAWASISAIPVVGPFLAPAVAAGVVASVIALGMHLSSAAGGWERVPQDTLTMLHKDEQVLPASYAEGLRKVVGGGGSPGGGSSTTNVNFHGCFDAKSFWQQQQGNVLSTIQDGLKNRRG